MTTDDPRAYYRNPNQPPPPEKKHTLRSILVGLAMVFLAACVVGTVVLMMVSPHSDKPLASTPSFVQPSTSKAAQQAPKKNVKPATIGEGTWHVGPDVKPGKYRTAGALDSVVPLCYWDVRKGSETGEYVDQGVANKTSEPGYVTLKTGQYFKTSGCQVWTPASS